MKRYQVFISSTFTDLEKERLVVLNTLLSLNCVPVGMELFPASSDDQFEYIKKIIDDSDYYVLIIGGRYGTISDDGLSYTEKEYNYAVSKNIPILAFLHKNPEDLPAKYTEFNSENRLKLDAFKERVSNKRLVSYWSSANHLARLVATSWHDIIQRYPRFGWIRSDTLVDNGSLLDQIGILTKENNNLKKTTNDYEIQLNYLKDLSKKYDAQILKNKELNSELDKTKSEVELLKSRTEINTVIHIKGFYTKMMHSSLFNEQFDLPISLGELFTIWGPYLFESPFSYVAKTYMESSIKKYLNAPFPQIDNDSFQKVKIQLLSEDLIDLHLQENEWRRREYISLTEKGRHYLTSHAF